MLGNSGGAPNWSITHQQHSFFHSCPAINVPGVISQTVLGSWGERFIKIARKTGWKRWRNGAVGQGPWRESSWVKVQQAHLFNYTVAKDKKKRLQVCRFLVLQSPGCPLGPGSTEHHQDGTSQSHTWVTHRAFACQRRSKTLLLLDG